VLRQDEPGHADAAVCHSIIDIEALATFAVFAAVDASGEHHVRDDPLTLMKDQRREDRLW